MAPLRKTLEDDVHVVREWSARSLEVITGQHLKYRNEKGEYVTPYTIYHYSARSLRSGISPVR